MGGCCSLAGVGVYVRKSHWAHALIAASADLVAAVRDDDDITLRRLVESGADMNTQTLDGHTLLGVAIRENKQKCVDYLESKGADAKGAATNKSRPLPPHSGRGDLPAAKSIEGATLGRIVTGRGLQNPGGFMWSTFMELINNLVCFVAHFRRAGNPASMTKDDIASDAEKCWMFAYARIEFPRTLSLVVWRRSSMIVMAFTTFAHAAFQFLGAWEAHGELSDLEEFSNDILTMKNVTDTFFWTSDFDLMLKLQGGPKYDPMTGVYVPLPQRVDGLKSDLGTLDSCEPSSRLFSNCTYYEGQRLESFAEYSARMGQVGLAKMLLEAEQKQVIILYAVSTCALLAWMFNLLALTSWYNLRKSRKYIAIGWLMTFIAPFVISVVPMKMFVDWDAFNPVSDAFFAEFTDYYKLKEKEEMVRENCIPIVNGSMEAQVMEQYNQLEADILDLIGPYQGDPCLDDELIYGSFFADCTAEEYNGGQVRMPLIFGNTVPTCPDFALKKSSIWQAVQDPQTGAFLPRAPSSSIRAKGGFIGKLFQPLPPFATIGCEEMVELARIRHTLNSTPPTVVLRSSLCARTTRQFFKEEASGVVNFIPSNLRQSFTNNFPSTSTALDGRLNDPGMDVPAILDQPFMQLCPVACQGCGALGSLIATCIGALQIADSSVQTGFTAARLTVRTSMDGLKTSIDATMSSMASTSSGVASSLGSVCSKIPSWPMGSTKSKCNSASDAANRLTDSIRDGRDKSTAEIEREKQKVLADLRAQEQDVRNKILTGRNNIMTSYAAVRVVCNTIRRNMHEVRNQTSNVFVLMGRGCRELVLTMTDPPGNADGALTTVKGMIDKTKIPVELFIGISHALNGFKIMVPAAIAIAPGLVKGALNVKMLVPQSSLPGVFIVVLPWLYCPIVWCLYNFAFQLIGNWMVLVGLILLAFGPMVNVIVGEWKHIAQPMTDKEVAVVTSVIERYTLMVMVLAGVSVIAFLLKIRSDIAEQADRVDAKGRTAEILSDMLQSTALISIAASTISKKFYTTLAGVDYMINTIVEDRRYEKMLVELKKPPVDDRGCCGRRKKPKLKVHSPNDDPAAGAKASATDGKVEEQTTENSESNPTSNKDTKHCCCCSKKPVEAPMSEIDELRLVVADRTRRLDDLCNLMYVEDDKEFMKRKGVGMQAARQMRSDAWKNATEIFKQLPLGYLTVTIHRASALSRNQEAVSDVEEQDKNQVVNNDIFVEVEFEEPNRRVQKFHTSAVQVTAATTDTQWSDAHWSTDSNNEFRIDTWEPQPRIFVHVYEEGRVRDRFCGEAVLSSSDILQLMAQPGQQQPKKQALGRCTQSAKVGKDNWSMDITTGWIQMSMRWDFPALSLGVLKVRCVGATNVRAADTGGTSDPFVVSFVTQPNQPSLQKFVTEKVMETVDPVWDELTSTFFFDIWSSDAVLWLDVYDADVVGDDFLGQACLPLQKLIDPEEDGLTVTKSLPLAACQTPDAPTKVTDITSDMISGDIQIEMAFSVDRSRLELGSRAQMDAALKDAMEQLHINRTERLDLLQLSDEAKLQMIATVRRRKATASTVHEEGETFKNKAYDGEVFSLPPRPTTPPRPRRPLPALTLEQPGPVVAATTAVSPKPASLTRRALPSLPVARGSGDGAQLKRAVPALPITAAELSAMAANAASDSGGGPALGSASTLGRIPPPLPLAP